jgi:hypothetical protein
MSTSVFDTLSYAKRLKAAGLTEAQAEAHAEALAAAVGSELVTKRDLSEAVRGLNEAITLSKRDLEARITVGEGRTNLLQWMTGFNIAISVTILFKVFA